MNNLPTSKGKCKNSILFLAFLLIYCLGISSLSAQNLKESSITLKVRNESVEKVFNQLTELTNFKFFYDQEVISKVPQVSLDVYDATLTQVLDKITSQTHYCPVKVDK
jgi:type II secretory pathway component GspD/PulD (secretin)